MSECSSISPAAGHCGGAGVAPRADARALGPSGVLTDQTGPSLVQELVLLEEVLAISAWHPIVWH